MGLEHEDAIRAEMADTSEFLHSLSDEQWDSPSLCDGWRVRDVIGHMVTGHSMGLPTLIASTAGAGFNVSKASSRGAIGYAESHEPGQILTDYDRVRTMPWTKGLVHILKGRDVLADHVIHHQDIRRPLGQPRDIPEDRMLISLDAMPRNKASFFNTKKVADGLRLVATDLDWSTGSGPEVTGPAEALLMALGRRPVALDALSGDGLPTLAARITATSFG
jgi:uncharacterized protein (TIGR03083 family)